MFNRSRNIVSNNPNPRETHSIIIDSGGGQTCTVTKNAWRVTHTTNHRTELSGYQDKNTQVCPIVNAVTKAHIKGRDEPVLLAINYATLIDDDEEKESLVVPFCMMAHGIQVDMVPEKYGGQSGMTVEETFLPFEYDNEKLFLRIEKPSRQDFDHFEIFELTSPYPELRNEVRRSRKRHLPEDIPMSEWRKRLAMTPEDVVAKTFDNTTQYYLSLESENRMDPRRHMKSRAPGLRLDRQHEPVASDTFFPSVKSDRGNTCSQMFLGTKSKRWEVYPMKLESHNGKALQDYIRKCGAPPSLKTDNAQSETGKTWTETCRTQCINTLTTEPHNPQQNPVENEIGSLGTMVTRNMRQFNVPLGKHDWCQKWCCDVHNHVANRTLNWRTPMEISTGFTPDISVFRFHIWEPIWYYDPTVKQPRDNLRKARWLGIAWQAGDAFTYYIQTERPRREGRNVILIRSIIKTRRKNIGKDTEYIEENPSLSMFFHDADGNPYPDSGETELEIDGPLTISFDGNTSTTIDESDKDSLITDGLTEQEFSSLTNDMTTGESTETSPSPTDSATGESTETSSSPTTEVGQDKTNELDPEESLPPEEQGGHISNPEELEEILDQFQVENDSDYRFDRIVDYRFEHGVLLLKANYVCDDNQIHTLEVPFSILKKDVPLELAKYIREHVVEMRRGGRYNTWAKKVITNHHRVVRRLYRQYNINIFSQRSRRTVKNTKAAIRKSTNARNAMKKSREKFGIRVPINTRQALQFDKENGNTKWAEAIAKEMTSLDKLSCFEYHGTDKQFNKSNGWQYATIHMIYDIKAEDRRHKARLVVGGHMIDASMHTKYSSNVQSMSVRMLLLVAAQAKLDLAACDIANAFPTAPCMEKVWSIAGPEFGIKAGAKVRIARALYGLATSSRAFHETLADLLRRIGFTPTRADPDLWYIKSQDHEGYDYLATHVDDIMVAAKRPMEYLHLIEQEFVLRNKEASPSYYLGADMKKIFDKYIHLSSHKYIEEMLKQYEKKYGTVAKTHTPMSHDKHPELDDSAFLDDTGVRQYQHLMGSFQWLLTCGRFDLAYAVCSLSRFQIAPRVGHLEQAVKVLGYLKKYKKRGYVINPKPPEFDLDAVDVPTPQDFGSQYHYFREEIDPRFPKALVTEMDTNIFVDADHGHDKVTGRSITGMIAFVGSTPMQWLSKRQPSVQTSTFGAEFTALKTAVEAAITIRYYLRSMGVVVTKPTNIMVDNMSVVISAFNPATTLNKKHIALAYHFVREHAASKVINILKIDSVDNFADPFTKGMSSGDHGDFYHEIMRN